MAFFRGLLTLNTWCYTASQESAQALDHFTGFSLYSSRTKYLVCNRCTSLPYPSAYLQPSQMVNPAPAAVPINPQNFRITVRVNNGATFKCAAFSGQALPHLNHASCGQPEPAPATSAPLCSNPNRGLSRTCCCWAFGPPG